MGILDKLIGGLNRVDQAVDNTEFRIFRDRRFEQADRLASEGVHNEGVLTGIMQRYNETTETALRVSWFAPELRHAGISIGTGVDRISGLRLGTTLALSVDGDRAALNWDTMARAWHVTAAVTQRAWRNVPDEGVDDTAVDMRVLSRWKKWPRQRGTVESFERRQAFGQSTQNWDIDIRCTDGSTRTVHKDEVPFYVHWFIAPGADVPIVVDPKDPTRAQIDYPVLAEQRAPAGGRWQEPPPPGSMAEQVLNAVAPVSQAARFNTAPMDLTPPPGGLAPIEGVDLQRWALVTASLMTARVKPAEYDAHAAATFGVPAGRWTAIDRQWSARPAQDWKVGAAMGEAVEAARRQLKGK
ncbi:MAG: hypothetical protein ABI808_05305 [Pseudonocardiales bacterium]